MGVHQPYNDDGDRGDSFREWRRVFLEKFSTFEKQLAQLHTEHLNGIREIRDEQAAARDEREELRLNLERLSAKIESLTVEVKKKTGPLVSATASPAANGDGSSKRNFAEALAEDVKGKWQFYAIIVTLTLNLFRDFIFKP